MAEPPKHVADQVDCQLPIDVLPKNIWHGLAARGSTGPIAMAAAGLLCVPIVWHYLENRASVFQGLDWIAAPTLGDSISVLGKLTFGPVWVWGLLVPAILMLFHQIIIQKIRNLQFI